MIIKWIFAFHQKNAKINRAMFAVIWMIFMNFGTLIRQWTPEVRGCQMSILKSQDGGRPTSWDFENLKHRDIWWWWWWGRKGFLGASVVRHLGFFELLISNSACSNVYLGNAAFFNHCANFCKKSVIQLQRYRDVYVILRHFPIEAERFAKYLPKEAWGGIPGHICAIPDDIIAVIHSSAPKPYAP